MAGQTSAFSACYKGVVLSCYAVFMFPMTTALVMLDLRVQYEMGETRSG